MQKSFPLVCCALLLTVGVSAQTRDEPKGATAPTRQSPLGHTETGASSGAVTPVPVTTPSDYLVGAGDGLRIDIPNLANEITPGTLFSVSGSGDLGLPLIGHIQAGGLTVAQLEGVVKERLNRILQDPDVTITVVTFGSQPVSVLGSVNSPGILQLAGGKNLFEVLSMAGGLSSNAGFQITITRDLKWHAIPLPGAHTDASGHFSIATVKIEDLLSSANSSANITILPNDKISVPTSELVYAIGNVVKPGGFLLNQHESLSALQVVSLAEGFNRTAAPQKAKILRVVPGSPTRIEIPVNLKELAAGKIPDFQLQPKDILFVPNSGSKSAGFRTLDAITGATGALIYAGAH